MRSNKLITGCGIALIVVLGLAAVLILMAKFLIPEVSQQMPVNANPVFVNITQPVNGKSIAVNQPVTIYVETFGGESIESVQLLVNGTEASGGNSSPSEKGKFLTFWSFTPDKEGQVTLLASAKTKEGEEGVSNAVYLQVVSQDQVPPALVDGSMIPPEVVTDDSTGEEPGGGNAVPPPPGFTDTGAIPDPPPFPESDGQPVVDDSGDSPIKSLIPIKFSLWVDSISKSVFGTSAPAAPKISGGVNECKGIIKVEDNATNEMGFNLYRLDPGMLMMTRIATLDAQNGKGKFTYSDPGLVKGIHTYRISAFNSAGETNSNILTINVNDEKCANPVQPGLSFDSMKLTAKTAVGKVYCYISANGSPWKRIPEGSNNFIQSSNGAFDLAPYLGVLPSPVPPETSLTINIQCWGWNGSDLVYLGASQQKWTPTGNLKLIGTSFDLEGIFSTGKPLMKGDLPQTELIAPPYYSKFINNSFDCININAQGQYLSKVQPCKFIFHVYEQYSVNLLIWAWDQLGHCDPKKDTCNTKLQPAEGFRVYILNSQGSQIWAEYNELRFYTQPVLPVTAHDEFYVTAFNNKIGESYNGPHVVYPLKLTTVDIYPQLENTMTRINGDGTGLQWTEYTKNPPGGLTTGYSHFCLNQDCTRPTALFWQYFGMGTFTLPDLPDLQTATIYWDSGKYKTDTSGSLDVINSCGVKLLMQVEGDPSIQTISTSSLWGVSGLDVTKQVKPVSNYTKKKIVFTFQPPHKSPGPGWNRCEWEVSNLKLKLRYLPK